MSLLLTCSNQTNGANSSPRSLLTPIFRSLLNLTCRSLLNPILDISHVSWSYRSFFTYVDLFPHKQVSFHICTSLFTCSNQWIGANPTPDPWPAHLSMSEHVLRFRDRMRSQKVTEHTNPNTPVYSPSYLGMSEQIVRFCNRICSRVTEHLYIPTHTRTIQLLVISLHALGYQNMF